MSALRCYWTRAHGEPHGATALESARYVDGWERPVPLYANTRLEAVEIARNRAHSCGARRFQLFGAGATLGKLMVDESFRPYTLFAPMSDELDGGCH